MRFSRASSPKVGQAFAQTSFSSCAKGCAKRRRENLVPAFPTRAPSNCTRRTTMSSILLLHESALRPPQAFLREGHLMGAREDIARLLKEAADSMKSDAKGAVIKLEAAYAIARATGGADDTAAVAEELA